jgi:hypothetical protein
LACVVTFAVADAVDLSGVSFEVDYSSAQGDFAGRGEGVSCRLAAAVSGLGAFNDAEAARTLTIGVVSGDTIAGPIDLVECDYGADVAPVTGDFVPTVLEASAPDYSATTATVEVSNITCTP